ncbi:MAG: hypothetical protein ACLR0U_17770 [Enterocloster clostridioformis]
MVEWPRPGTSADMQRWGGSSAEGFVRHAPRRVQRMLCIASTRDHEINDGYGTVS